MPSGLPDVHASKSGETWTPEPARSALMRRVRRRHTAPEMIVRRELHRRGFRYRLHVRDLPGSPDLVFPARRLAVFVHGCFWHRHEDCPAATTPKTRTEFWSSKFQANVARDARKTAELVELGWRVHIIWECEARRGDGFDRLLSELDPTPT